MLCPIAKAILPRLTTCVFSKAENWGHFYEPPGICTKPFCSSCSCSCSCSFSFFLIIITITSLCVYAYKLLYYECTVLWKQWLCFRPRQQVKIALHCRNIFADSLLTEPLDSFQVRLFHVCRYITEIFMNDSSTFVVITINTF